MRYAIRGLVALVLIASIAADHTAVGQVTSETQEEAESTNPVDALRSRLSAGPAAGTLALEGPVDPEEYIVGPGDLFVLLIRGLETGSGGIAVTADGRLPLPDTGSIRVADLTLAAARDSIIRALRPAFGRTEVDAALVRPRSFYVHVTGAVGSPGRYAAGPSWRLSNVLTDAFAGASRALASNLSLRPSLRNVTVVRRDGTELKVDLPRYFAGGGTEHNPYLRDGDVIVVTSYDPDYESIRIDGAVPFPGSYDARPGDTLAGLLEVAGVRDVGGYAKSVRVTRHSEDGTPQIDLVDLDSALSGSASAWPLKARDHVSVAPESLPGGMASIEGWVNHPGTYPIREGVTTLVELVEASGGLRDDALTSGAYLMRAVTEAASTDVDRVAGRPGYLPDLSELVGRDSMAFMQRMRLSDLSLIGRMHFALAYRFQNTVPVDVEGMLAGTAEPVALMDGDRLVIPRDRHSVYVFGQVVNPGFVAFEQGRTMADYVDAAGGPGSNGGSTMLLRNRNGQLFDDPDIEVLSGDLVFVDRARPVTESLAAQQASFQDRQATSAERQVEIAEDQNRRTSRYQLASTVLSAVSSIGTVIALIISLRRN